VASVKWTPLIRVEGVDPAIGAARIETIAEMVKQAEFLSRTLLQKKGHNRVGQVVNHENFSVKMATARVKKNTLTTSEAAVANTEVPVTSAGGGSGASNLKRPSSTIVSKSKRLKASDSLVRVSKQDLFAKIAPERRLVAEAAVLHILNDDSQCITDIVNSGPDVEDVAANDVPMIDDDIVLPHKMEGGATSSYPSGPKPDDSPAGFRIDMTTEPATIVTLQKGVRLLWSCAVVVADWKPTRCNLAHVAAITTMDPFDLNAQGITARAMRVRTRSSLDHHPSLSMALMKYCMRMLMSQRLIELSNRPKGTVSNSRDSSYLRFLLQCLD